MLVFQQLDIWLTLVSTVHDALNNSVVNAIFSRKFLPFDTALQFKYYIVHICTVLGQCFDLKLIWPQFAWRHENVCSPPTVRTDRPQDYSQGTYLGCSHGRGRVWCNGRVVADPPRADDRTLQSWSVVRNECAPLCCQTGKFRWVTNAGYERQWGLAYMGVRLWTMKIWALNCSRFARLVSRFRILDWRDIRTI